MAVTGTRGGQLEVALVEPALEHRRPLDQVHHLGQLAHRVDPFAAGVEPSLDQLAALPGVGHHARRPHVLQVGTGGSQPHRAAQETVTLGSSPDVTPAASMRTTASSILTTSQRIGRAKRPPSQRIVFENWRPPIAPRTMSGTRLVERSGAAARASPTGCRRALPARLPSAVLAGEPGPRRLGGVGPGAAHLAPLRRPLRRQAEHDQGQPARADMNAGLVRRQAGRRDPALDQRGQLRRGLVACRRRAAPRSRSRPAGQASPSPSLAC